ncbi:MAG: O-antigen ligase family protein [Candidatus Binatia bacterium]
MLLVAISALPLLVMVFYRYPQLLLWSFPLVSLVEVFFPFYPFRVGSISLLPLDSVYFFTISYLGISVLRNPRRVAAVLNENIFLTCFLGIVALYAVLYLPVFGQSAVGEARKFFGVFLFPLFALMVVRKPEDLHRLIQVVIVTATLAAVTLLVRAAMQGSIVRVLNAEGTLIIALAAFAMAVHRVHRIIVIHPTADCVLLFLFVALAIGSGQRSVWLAVGSGLMTAVWLHRGRPVFVIKTAMLALWLLMASGAALVYFPEAGARLGEKFAGIIDPYSDRNASWRIEGWQQQLSELRGAKLIFGEGLGGYYGWQSGSYEVEASPHNAYVQLILKFGLFGLTVYGLLVLQFFRNALSIRKKVPRGPIRAYLEMGILNFGAAHGYMMGYSFEPVMLMFFAVATCAAKLCHVSFQTSRLLEARAVRNDPGIAPQRFPPQRGPEAVAP